MIFIAATVYTRWTEKKNPTTDSPSSVKSVEEVENPSDDSAIQQQTGAKKKLSAAAYAIEQMYFHGAYTDLGTVEIYHFNERPELLEKMAYFLSDEMEGQSVSVELHRKLLEDDFYYVTEQETTYCYIGETRNGRPHGYGMLLESSNNGRTYEFLNVPAIYCAGRFKNGMIDGYGALFSVNDYDITQAVQNVAETGLLDEDHCEVLVNYLFNYVRHEGYFEKTMQMDAVMISHFQLMRVRFIFWSR